MTREELEQTVWGMKFARNAPSCFDKAAEYALDSNERFSIYLTSELDDEDWFVIVPASNKEFWMDAKSSLKEAVILCQLMGWKLANSVDTTQWL
jgi:hypothetical protein